MFNLRLALSDGKNAGTLFTGNYFRFRFLKQRKWDKYAIYDRELLPPGRKHFEQRLRSTSTPGEQSDPYDSVVYDFGCVLFDTCIISDVYHFVRVSFQMRIISDVYHFRCVSFHMCIGKKLAFRVFLPVQMFPRLKQLCYCDSLNTKQRVGN